MPDYNPAVATGVQPPPNALSGTFGTIMDLQRTQAQTSLLQLQQLQQAREYNALQAASQAMQSGEDGGLAYIRAGGQNPNYPATLQNYAATKNAIGAAGGVLPTQRSELLGLPGVAAESQIKQIGVGEAQSKAQTAATQASEEDTKFRGQLAAQLQANPTQETLRNLLPQFVGHVSENGMKELLSAATGNENRDVISGIATRMQAATMTPQEQAQTIQPGGTAPAVPGQQTATAQPRLKTPAEVEQEKQQSGYFSKLYSGISALGNTSAASLEDIRLAKAAINDPNFWSGTGETYNLMYKRALALGGSTVALPQEVFKKVMAANVLQQTNGMKAAAEEMGASSSRLFQSQIELMERAAQNPENTIASNRFLTELAERTANKNIKLSDSAADYKNGKLDPQFEKQFRKDASAPQFSNWELSHLDTIGAPIADKLKQIDPREIAHLKDNPKNAAKFDAYYGPGTSKAAMAQ